MKGKVFRLKVKGQRVTKNKRQWKKLFFNRTILQPRQQKYSIPMSVPNSKKDIRKCMNA